VWGRIETLAIKSNPISPCFGGELHASVFHYDLHTSPSLACPGYRLEEEGTAGDREEQVHVRCWSCTHVVLLTTLEVYSTSCPEDDAELERNTYPRLPAASSKHVARRSREP
jgi:hypothetical protein